MTGQNECGEVLALFFNPETVELLGIRVESGHLPINEIEAVPPPEVDFDVPARTPEEGACQAALALAAPDLELLDRVVHWQSPYEEARAEHVAENEGQDDVEPFMDRAAFKADRKAYVERKFKKRPRGLLATALKASRNHLELEDLDSGEIQVTLPALFKSLVVVVKEVDGVWYLSRMPEKPR